MKLISSIAGAAVIGWSLVPTVSADASDFCEEIRGATLVADDGTYLGKIDSAYNAESIFNEYGSYGSKYNNKSIWNEYGTYGSKYSIHSPFNKYSSTPPTFYTTNKKSGKLTVNNSLPHAFNPYAVKTCFP